jgi:predicted MPP superfamily phosphohydrolase
MGNHDLATMIKPLEAAGIRILLNDHTILRRGGDEIQLVGLDDVHAYQLAADAEAALAGMPAGFRILLQHSPELLDEAESAKVSLYLTGHTHGGQICLPGGRPIMTNIRSHRRYASGLWQHGRMTGYTTAGVGVSVMPLRFFSKGEVAIITLRQG